VQQEKKTPFERFESGESGGKESSSKRQAEQKQRHRAEAQSGKLGQRHKTASPDSPIDLPEWPVFACCCPPNWPMPQSS
jgi:hypothetical protein